MQRLVELRRRMRTVRSIRGVARTMATVASAKLSRTRERAAGMRVYTGRMRDVILQQQRAAEALDLDLERLSPYLKRRPPKRLLLVHLSGDRGMCGGYNVAIGRLAASFIAEKQAAGVEVGVIAKGQKGERYLRRRAGADVLDVSGWPRSGVTSAEVDALFARLTGAFMAGECDEVWCTYTEFVTPLRRYPRAVRLLPLSILGETRTPVADGGPEGRRWFYEPALEPILTELLGEFLRMQIEDVLLEAYASEQGARMITMEEATERADKSLVELTVAFNRSRREAITTDLLGVLFASAVRAEAGGVAEGSGG